MNIHPLAPAVPGQLSIGGITQATRHERRYGAVITLEDPRCERMSDRLRLRADRRHLQLVLRFEDVDHDDGTLWAPTRDDARAILAFGRTHRDAALLVHCQAGVARSTAAALGILADRLGPGREAEALAQLLALREIACPNLVLVAHMDDELGRTGDLMAVVTRRDADDRGTPTLRDRRARYLRENPSEFARRPT